ncbi:hypothetical protein AB3N60_11990 [Leptospira sp. WS39.C2]
MGNTLKSSFLVLFVLLTIGLHTTCKSHLTKQSNEKFFDENLHLFESLTDEEIKSITNNVTIRTFDPNFHGNQIAFNETNGKTYLWYPNNKKLIMGNYKIKNNSVLCFMYFGNVKNEVTGEVGGVWNCTPLHSYYVRIKEKTNSNVFQMNESLKMPFILNRFPEESFSSLLEKYKLTKEN